MWEDILSLAVKNGLWAVLFVSLLLFVLKDSAKREKKYQQTISELSTHLGVVKEIKEQIEDIKDFVFKTKKKSKKSIVEENLTVQKENTNELENKNS